MSALVMFGVDARHAALDARAPYALAPDQVDAALRRLVDCPGVLEAVVLSTCNRTEVYVVADAPWDDRWSSATWPSLPPQRPAVVRLEEAVATHLLRVACGLEATLLGDTHIVGQVRDAYGRAVAAGTVGPLLHRLCQSAFRTAKRVRRETALGAGRVTLGGVVAQWLDEREVAASAAVAVIGTGIVAVDVARHLTKGGRAVALVSRDVRRAEAVARRCGAHAVAVERVQEWLVGADVVIGATRSAVPVLTADTIVAVRPAAPWPLLVDLGVPRNFEAPGVVRATVDDMVGRMDGARAARQAAVPAAEALVAAAADEWLAWRRLRAWVPAIVALVAQAATHAGAGGAPQDRLALRAALHRKVVQVRHRAQAGRSRRAIRHAAA